MLDEEMIPLAEAEQRYSLSRDGIYYHVRKGNLQTYKRLGDRKSYLKVSELEALAGFKPSPYRRSIAQKKELQAEAAAAVNQAVGESRATAVTKAA